MFKIFFRPKTRSNSYLKCSILRNASTGCLTAENIRNFPKINQNVNVIFPKLENDFKLQLGKFLSKDAIQIKYATFGMPEIGKPIVLLCPSMSNSVHAIDFETDRGWWRKIIGFGNQFGINLDDYFVVCGAPLGTPFGSTSPISLDPITGKNFGSTFPQVTPKDQAAFQCLLLDALGISNVHCVIGASMGGMQAIQMAVHFGERTKSFISIASTAKTSPGTVALRSVQRSAVMMDPAFNGGDYNANHPPDEGMRVARKFGTICYRSHDEFNARFDWKADQDQRFEVEKYLDHQANVFVTRQNKYDANCYLAMSKSMDLQDIGLGEMSFDEAVGKIPKDMQSMLLSYSSDRLTPPEEHETLSNALKRHGISTHFEVLGSRFGHDAFLVESEAKHLNLRLNTFLNGNLQNAVERVKLLFEQTHHL